MTNERIFALVTHPNMLDIKSIRSKWLMEYQLVFDVSAFRINDKDIGTELNSTIEFPYAIVLDDSSKTIFGNIIVHLRKGIWTFIEQIDEANEHPLIVSSVSCEQYKNMKWFHKIEKMLFK